MNSGQYQKGQISPNKGSKNKTGVGTTNYPKGSEQESWELVYKRYLRSLKTVKESSAHGFKHWLTQNYNPPTKK